MTNLGGEHDHYGRLVDEGARLVFVNGALDGLEVAGVSVDERHAGYVATQHLISLGHGRIGFVAGTGALPADAEKAVGRNEALRDAGLTDGLVAHGDFSFEGGRRALRAAREARTHRPA